MKAEDIDVGTYDIGAFTIHVSFLPFEDKPTDEVEYFSILLTEKVGAYTNYIHLQADVRFGIFNHFANFSRPLSGIDVVEYYAHVWKTSQKLVQPNFQLHRHSIVALFKTCQSHRATYLRLSQIRSATTNTIHQYGGKFTG